MLLPVALAIVAVVAYAPHENILTGQTREYPIHMDEYIHWQTAKAVLEGGSVTPRSLVDGGVPHELLATSLHERGFHAYLAALQDATNLPWQVLFQITPVLIALVGALAAFVFASRWDAGAEAALFVAAVPTTLRFLGPGFLVPIAWTLPAIAFGLHLLASPPATRTYVALAILCAGLWPIHAMGALIMLVLTALVALATTEHPARSAALAGIAALPALVAYPYYKGALGDPLQHPLLPADLPNVRLAGIGLFLLAGIGVAMMAMRRRDLPVGIAIGATLLAAISVVIVRVEFGLDAFRAYDRSITILPFLAAIPAGVAIARVRHALQRLRWRGLAPVGIALLLLMQLTIVQAAAVGQMSRPLYEVVTPQRFNEYLSVRDDLQGHQLAIVDGQTIPFTIATGLPTIYVVLPLGGPPPDSLATFFEEGASDTLFILASGATVVVTDRPVANPHLRQVSPSVYVLDEGALPRASGVKTA